MEVPSILVKCVNCELHCKVIWKCHWVFLFGPLIFSRENSLIFGLKEDLSASVLRAKWKKTAGNLGIHYIHSDESYFCHYYLHPQLYLEDLSPEIFYCNLFKSKVFFFSVGWSHFQLPSVEGDLIASYIDMNQSLFSSIFLPRMPGVTDYWIFRGFLRYKSGWLVLRCLNTGLRLSYLIYFLASRILSLYPLVFSILFIF